MQTRTTVKEDVLKVIVDDRSGGLTLNKILRQVQVGYRIRDIGMYDGAFLPETVAEIYAAIRDLIAEGAIQELPALQLKAVARSWEVVYRPK